MATQFEVLLPFGTPDANEAAQMGLELIDRVEDQLTVFRDSSEMSRINRDAFAHAVVAEDKLFQLISLAARVSAETNGAYDITTGALTKAWGFFRRSQRVPTVSERAEVLERTGMQHVVLDGDRSSVRFLRRGLEINLGSIGKGFALDQVADLYRMQGVVTSALLHGGSSSVYALGSEPGGKRGWSVGIRHPWDQERRLAVLRLRDRGLATSAATFQHLECDGRKLGHILDPRTGWPAEGIASATVVAPTAAEADALSTAFFILGIDGTRQYCEQHPEVGALLLSAEENAKPWTIGIPPSDIQWAIEV